MTFTHFINHPQFAAGMQMPSFATLVRHPLWPTSSNRLEDFETFLLNLAEEEGGDVIQELHGAWYDFAQRFPEGKHDLDLVAAAWADYARHLRTCSGDRDDPCNVAQSLLERALEVSSFDDLNHAMREATRCRFTGPVEEDEPDDEESPDEPSDDDAPADLF